MVKQHKPYLGRALPEKSKEVRIWLKKQWYERLVEIAEEVGLKVPELVRSIVVQHIKNIKSIEEQKQEQKDKDYSNQK